MAMPAAVLHDWPLMAAQSMSTMAPASPQAAAVFDLFTITLVIMTVVLFVVCGWIGYILVKFRGRPEDSGPDPEPVYGNRKLEIVWTVIPALIVALLTVLTVRDVGRSRPAAAAGQRPDVIVIGHQWWWEVQYPATGLVTANEVHVPTGRSSLVQLRSADVVHDFWVPQLGPKEDMVPTNINHVFLEPAQAGIYDGVCAEFCGNDHAWMRVRVIAQPPAEFDAWMRTQLQPVAAPATALADAGRQVFEKNTCRNCHALAGVPAATATVGPDLTNLGDRTILAAGTLENSRQNLAAWLKLPQYYKPGNYMPDFHLTDEEVNALTEFLWRKSGGAR